MESFQPRTHTHVITHRPNRRLKKAPILCSASSYNDHSIKRSHIKPSTFHQGRGMGGHQPSIYLLSPVSCTRAHWDTPPQHYHTSRYSSPMNPPGKHGSVLTFPSTFTNRWASILVTSFPFRAYFNLFRKKMISGRHSLSLCGPGDGRGA